MTRIEKHKILDMPMAEDFGLLCLPRSVNGPSSWRSWMRWNSSPPSMLLRTSDRHRETNRLLDTNIHEKLRVHDVIGWRLFFACVRNKTIQLIRHQYIPCRPYTLIIDGMQYVTQFDIAQHRSIWLNRLTIIHLRNILSGTFIVYESCGKKRLLVSFFTNMWRFFMCSLIRI